MKTVEFAGQKKPPSKIVCVGRNYVEHIEELGNELPDQMVVFFKPNSALASGLNSFHEETLHYEAEIALGVVGNAIRYVGFAFDLTKRSLQASLQEKGLPWERCKAFSGSAVLSELIAVDGIPDNLELELWVNGELRQQGGVSLMIHKPQSIMDELQEFTELEDHDVILTGTPKGVGALEAGAEYTGLVKSGQEVLVRKTWIAQ